jgi:hypothetical protein
MTTLRSLSGDAREEAEPHFVLERGDGVPAQLRTDQVLRVSRERPVHVSRHARDLRNLREVEARVVGRVHVHAELREQDGAADAVPVVPAPEVLLLQTLRFDDVMDDHVGDVEAAQTRGARAEVPFALRLISQRACFPAEAVVEQVDSVERFAPRRGVDAERPWNLHAELEWLFAVILQREHRPMLSGAVGEPGRTSALPERIDFAADVIAAEGFETGGGARQPIGLDARVIIGRRDDLPASCPDAGVDRRVAALLRLEQIPQRRRE